MKKLKPFPYYGGKFYILKHILPLIPEHLCYVEVFGGSGIVLFNKPISKIEIFNDLDEEIYIFFKVLRQRKNELIELLQNTPYHRQELIDANNISENDDETEIARKFFVKATMSFNSQVGSYRGFSISKLKNSAVSYFNLIDSLNVIANRMKYVQIEKRDYKYMLTTYCNSKDVFAYLDPPYLRQTRNDYNNYKYEMTDQQHTEMLELCISSPAKMLISGYDSELYNNYLKGWNRKVIEVRAHSSSTSNNRSKVKPMRKEVLWYNYEINSLFCKE